MPAISLDFLWTILGGVLLIGVAWGHLRSKANSNAAAISELRSDVDTKFQARTDAQEKRDEAQDAATKELSTSLESHRTETRRKLDDQGKTMGNIQVTLATISTNVQNLVGWTGKIERRLDGTDKAE